MQARALRRLTLSERLQETMRFCDEMRSLCAAGVRRRHPEYDADRVSEEVGRIALEIAPRLD